MSDTIDEETPLLADQDIQQSGSTRQRTPLPRRQFSILLLLQVSGPISSQVIAPFLPQLIKDIGVTDGKDSRVGYYAGLMHSLFYLTEACTVFHWSCMSDQIGRKPVILVGLFGLSASMWSFGLSKTFWGLVVSRCLNGALNGNVGVMKSMTIEITDPSNIAQAYGILPIPWSLGMAVGPLIGGSLARPVERFPDTFGDSAFLKEYPYFLPCSVSATIIALSWLITFIFLKETTKRRVTLVQYLCGSKVDESRPDSQVQAHQTPGPVAADEQLPLRALLVRPVLIATGCYALLSLVDIAFRSFVPVFYAMPIEIGGLSLDPPAIGNILALVGISGGILQWLLFAPMHDWLGAKPMFMITLFLRIPIVALFPALNAAARAHGLGGLVWFLVGLQMTLNMFANFGFAISFMYVSAAAPNKSSIGATNGLAQMVVSFMRAIGPAVVNSVFSFSIEENILGGYLAYWMMLAMTGLTLGVSFLLPKKMWNEEYRSG